MEEWGTGVNILEKRRRGVFEVGGLMRTPGKLGCNLGVTMDTSKHAGIWRNIDNNNPEAWIN